MPPPAAPAPLEALFEQQAGACERLGSPFMARLLRVCGARLKPGTPVADRLIGWPDDATALGDATALRFAGALHALVLMQRDPALMAAYPPNDADDDMLWRAVANALVTHEMHMMTWLDSAPQTNEVRRSVAMLSAAQIVAQRFPGLPLRVSEIGASAGLNLYFDRYALALPDGSTRGAADPVITLQPDWSGPLPADAPFEIAERRGVDLNPLDPTETAARLRLRSYTWPDQPDRMARLDAALSIAKPCVDRADAALWLPERLAEPKPGQVDFVFHTIAWQYFPPEIDAACRKALEDAAARATPDAPFAHLSVETLRHGNGAEVALTLSTGGTPERLILGHMDPHGRRMEATPAIAG